jgi:hypothetical protein
MKSGILNDLSKSFAIKTPTLLFIKVIGDESTFFQCHLCRVQRVLGNRDHDSIVRVSDEKLVAEIDSFRCSISHHDVVYVYFHARTVVALFDELSHKLANISKTFRVGSVCSHWVADSFSIPVYSFNSVFAKCSLLITKVREGHSS